MNLFQRGDQNSPGAAELFKGWSLSGNTLMGESAKEPSYPSNQDVDIANKTDRSYGDPSSGFFTKGGAKVRTTDISNIPTMVNRGPLMGGKSVPVDQKTADQLQKAWIASQKSAISSLGFDPRAFILSPPSQKRLTVAGLYDKSTDTAWYDQNNESAMVHESLHRGMRKLRDAGEMPDPPQGQERISEESLVRALMLKNFGGVEYSGKEKMTAGDRQINAAKYSVDPKYLDSIEAAAAKLYAKNRPRGPR